MNQTLLDSIVHGTCKHKIIHGAVFHISSQEKSLNLTSSCGNMQPDSRFYIASINKLFIASLVLQLVNKNRLKLTDRISEYLPENIWKGLLKFNGQDYSGQITIQQLLSHTSGLPCYLIDKRPDGKKNMDLILNGEDQAWPLEKVVEEVRKMKPKFIPGSPGKASYGETGFRLLDCILQHIHTKPVNDLYSGMFQELNMSDTEVLPAKSGKPYTPVYHRHNVIGLDKYFETSQHDVASTAKDLNIFLKAYFSGYFYPKNQLEKLEEWNNIFFPFKYGVGIQRFYVPRILSPFKPVPKIIGHSGSVGSVAFHVPEKSIYITGTVNQTSSPSLVFRMMMKIISKC